MRFEVAPSDFRVDQRVQAHPGTDIWMRGVRFGNVAKVGRVFVHVKMDNGQTYKFNPNYISAV